MNRSPDLDRDFAQFCRHADPEALGRVFDATAGHLLRIAAWLCGNRADAEDAVQRAFLVAIEQRATFRRGRPAMPWLVGLLTNQVHKVRRERARRAPALTAPASEPDPAVRAAGAELEQALAGVVQGLGASYHDVLHLHLREGLAAHEIAQRLGRPAGTVRTQIVRGVQELRRRLPSGFASAFAPAWLGEGPPAPGSALRDAVLAEARAQQAAVVTTTWVAARAPLLLVAISAAVVVGIGLAWWLPSHVAGTPAGHATASIPAEQGTDGARRGDGSAVPAAGATRDDVTRGTEAPLREAVAASAAPADAGLAVRVHDGATQPLAGARVWLCDSTWREGEEERVAFARADAAGMARFAAPPELDTILVLAEGRRPVQVARSHGAAEQQVVIDQPLSITGTVVVDGQRPVSPIELVAASDEAPRAWCDAALAALEPFDPKEFAGTATCDPNGRFAFFGLLPGMEYEVKPRLRAWKLPGTWGTEPSVTVAPLAVDAVLELASLPVITGRPVLPEGVAAKGRKRVWIWPRFVARNGDSVEWGGYPCRIGEQFTVPVRDVPGSAADLATTTLEFLHGPAKTNPIAATRTVAGPFTGVHDLGDVVLDDRSSENELLVVDRRNTPVAGAQVLSFNKLSAPAEADGRVRARVPPASARIVVGAKGYRARAIDVTDGMQWPLLVVLDEANRLRVEARAAVSGTKLAPLMVNLVFADRPPDHDLGDDFRVNELRGSKPIAVMANAETETLHFAMPPAAAFELCDLPPGIVFTVQLCDAFGHEIAAEAVALRADELRDVRFVVSQLPRRLAGQVVDAEGRPLRGVLVSVGPNDWDPRATDAEGRFAVDGVYADSPTLQFDRDGFRQLIVHGADLFDRSTWRLECAASSTR